jgi:hypothetical protein
MCKVNYADGQYHKSMRLEDMRRSWVRRQVLAWPGSPLSVEVVERGSR